MRDPSAHAGSGCGILAVGGASPTKRMAVVEAYV